MSGVIPLQSSCLWATATESHAKAQRRYEEGKTRRRKGGRQLMATPLPPRLYGKGQPRVLPGNVPYTGWIPPAPSGASGLMRTPHPGFRPGLLSPAPCGASRRLEWGNVEHPAKKRERGPTATRGSSRRLVATGDGRAPTPRGYTEDFASLPKPHRRPPASRNGNGCPGWIRGEPWRICGVCWMRNQSQQ
jgi:hypothetical protein